MLPIQSSFIDPSDTDASYDDQGRPRITVTPVADKLDIDALADKYGSTTPKVALPDANTNIDALADKYGKLAEPTLPKDHTEQNGMFHNLVTGAGQGIKDAALSAGQFLLKTDNPDIDTKVNDAIQKQNEQYSKEHGDSTAASIGRVTGQVAATAPLLPAKAMEGITLASKALPAIVNKLGTAVGRGAAAGGVFGATTNSTNQEGLPRNIIENAAGGAVGGPLIERTGALLSKIVPAAKAVWAKFGPIQQLANTSGVSASSIRNTIEVLENAGFTPESAQAALTKMGPKATLADLDPSLTTELSGIAALGGKPTAIAKGRMQARADTADSSAVGIVTKELGAKPNIEAEKEAIYKQAIKDTKPYYDAAKNSGDKLDIKSLIADIRDKLKTAVGEKEKVLKTIGSYFLRKDAEGKFTNEIKDTIPELHEVRIGLDAILESKNPTTTLGKHAKGVLSDARKQVDDELKSNDAMKIADEKFAEHMKVKQNLDYDWTKGNKEEFQVKFVNSTANEQKAIRTKMLADIYDKMESASRGELAGAQQQFGKKSVNRAKLQIAFGGKADKVLDALANEGAQRGTEKAIIGGSQTAEREAVKEKYTRHPSSGIIKEAAKGIGLDLAGGSPALATVWLGTKKAVGNRLIQFSDNKLGALREGTADLLSRQGLGRDNALSSMSKVRTIQNSILASKSKQVKLPIALAPIAGQGGHESYKKLVGQR